MRKKLLVVSVIALTWCVFLGNIYSQTYNNLSPHIRKSPVNSVSSQMDIKEDNLGNNQDVMRTMMNNDKLQNIVNGPDCDKVVNMMQILIENYKECTANQSPTPGVICRRTTNCFPLPLPAGGGEICEFKCDDGTSIVGK